MSALRNASCFFVIFFSRFASVISLYTPMQSIFQKDKTQALNLVCRRKLFISFFRCASVWCILKAKSFINRLKAITKSGFNVKHYKLPILMLFAWKLRLISNIVLFFPFYSIRKVLYFFRFSFQLSLKITRFNKKILLQCGIYWVFQFENLYSLFHIFTVIDDDDCKQLVITCLFIYSLC